MRKNKKETAANPILHILRPVIIGTLLGAVFCMLLLVGAALIMASSGRLPQSAVPMITIAVSGISAFLGGFVTAKIAKARGLLLGVCTGLILFLLEFLAGLSVVGGEADLAVLTKGAVMMLSGAIGGVLAVMRQKA